ncbi:MAG TPA: hypothetical protein VK976_13860 [Verrucomicrobiae bacterium]|nr:hypothetical protein [Verrucomicrobiae bacterium]
MKTSGRQIAITMVIASAALLVAGCSINVDDKDKKNEKVDIKTPFANLKVDSSAKAVDNGIPVYPGAKLRPAEKDGDNHSANIDMGAFGFGLKVIAAEYDSEDSPEKVKAFYEDKMKTFGPMLVCKGHNDDSGDVHINKKGGDDRKLSCDDTSGDGWEIKAGSNDNQHLVSIEPNGSGTRFGTVYIQTKGKDSDDKKSTL